MQRHSSAIPQTLLGGMWPYESLSIEEHTCNEGINRCGITMKWVFGISVTAPDCVMLTPPFFRWVKTQWWPESVTSKSHSLLEQFYASVL